MYLEKLMSIYQETDCHAYYPQTLLQNLEKYIQHNIDNKQYVISPYKFASDYSIAVDEALQFFMYFTNKDGVLDITFFFECTNPSCSSNRIFIEQEIIDLGDENIDEPILCDDCCKDYLISDVIKFIKAYFTIKPQVFSANTSVRKKDRNSTFEALKGMPDTLKQDSPPSSSNHEKATDGGENDSVSLFSMTQANERSGSPVSEQQLMSFMRKISSYVRS